MHIYTGQAASWLAAKATLLRTNLDKGPSSPSEEEWAIIEPGWQPRICSRRKRV